MKTLVLGGTQFIGRHVVTELLRQGHNVTLLNRGRTGRDLFPSLPRIFADRQTDELDNARELRTDWDAIIDLSGYFPRDVERFLQLIRGHCGRYVYCSTVSAYEATRMNGPTLLIQESDPLKRCSDAQALDTSMESYGERKAECERVITRQQEIPYVILRPSVVYGSHDHTDRMAYWIYRAAEKKPFILPEGGLTVTRRTYAPDLARAFAAAVVKREAVGQAYNIAEIDCLSLRDTMYWLGKRINTDPLEYAVAMTANELETEKIRPWTDLPFWIPHMNLIFDTFLSRRDLDFIGTPSPIALGEAAEAFLAEKREPRAGLSLAIEREILERRAKNS